MIVTGVLWHPKLSYSPKRSAYRSFPIRIRLANSMDRIRFGKARSINRIWFNESFSRVRSGWRLRYHCSHQEMERSHHMDLLSAGLWSVPSFVYIGSCRARLLLSLARLQNIAFAICCDITNLTALFIMLVNSSTKSSISIFPLESFPIISWTLLTVQLSSNTLSKALSTLSLLEPVTCQS